MNKVAVIMSVYRSDHFDHLKVAVESILNQSHRDLFLFIYRDGPISNDINSYIEQQCFIDSRIKYIKSDTNNGLAIALNVLIDIVMGDGTYDYIARMDSDDIARKDRLTKQVEFMNLQLDVDVCGTSCKEFGASFSLPEKHLPTTHDELLEFSITRCPFIHPSVMFRTSVFSSGIRYPADTTFTEDMALWFLLLMKGYKFANINEILLYYRLNDKTLHRRRGFSKACSEMLVRSSYMFKLKKISLKNVLLIIARLVFHMIPVFFVKYAYKNLR